eukprot:209148-Prorocentrum_minimum.AAC.2
MHPFWSIYPRYRGGNPTTYVTMYTSLQYRLSDPSFRFLFVLGGSAGLVVNPRSVHKIRLRRATSTTSCQVDSCLGTVIK